MKDSFATTLHLRELQHATVRATHTRKLYGSRRLINDLDIVNELGGHSGCVNALSWSKSGNLLASGSDDQHINIHTYQPDDANSQFKMGTTISTGHKANIFSVKFMPYSNDKIIISAAGDGEVRIFDLEHHGQAAEASRASTMSSEGRRRGRNAIFEGVRYLTDGDTGAKVYRSHGDRVKRIVTESSPYLFLTCSEDGEVRQWDLRQPSSAYPPPRGQRLGQETAVPPPLISYKRYSLDLNTISCSPSQPHYIALGGAHLHAFLHDRRMTGRDKLLEMGKPLSALNQLSPEEEELLAQATQCVRKFAPQGQRRMKRTDNGHITACKISDAKPDEMVVSWSGDHIYSFDLVRDPNTNDENALRSPRRINKTGGSLDRKRKRRVGGSEASLHGNASTRPRTESASADGEEASLRIRYQNGQSERLPLRNQTPQDSPRPQLTERQRMAQQIARNTVKLRSAIFESSSFTEALGLAATTLSEADEIMRDWTYPIDPSPEQVHFQQTLRRNRESSRRFVQAAGTISRVLGGKITTVSGASAMTDHFLAVEARRNDLELTRQEHFGYDFLKAILLWLDSGVGRMVEGFTRPADMSPTSKAALRLPIAEEDATPEAIDEVLIPHLLHLASERPVMNVETNRFESDDHRTLFETEKAAVLAFAAALRIPFEDLSSAVVQTESAEMAHAQDRKNAHRYWASKVSRGVLLNAAEGVTFALVDRAYGGLGRVMREVMGDEARLDLLRQSNSEDDDRHMHAGEGLDSTEDLVIAAQEIRQRGQQHLDGERDEEVFQDEDRAGDPLPHGVDSMTRGTSIESEEHEQSSHEGDDYDDDNDDDDNDDDDNDDDEYDDNDADMNSNIDDSRDDSQSDSSSDADAVDEVPNYGPSPFVYRTAFERRRMKPKVESGTPCSGPTRQYHGHCNVRTVKDVNYFGLDDEYVVSGSDDGNLFIWDRKTSELVNILEGDGEVVNVIQGHPYETMLAVSGIDHTIKIFSSDARAREVARLNLCAHDASSFSSLAWPPRVGRRPQRPRETPAGAETMSEAPADGDEDDSYVAPTGLSSRRRMPDAYRIMQNNVIEREGGNQEAVITRALLSQLAQRIRQSRAESGVQQTDTADENRRVILDDNCVPQ